MNYLQLCQDYVSELGLSGATGPAAVTGNTITELKNVVRWIRDAALQIDNEWLDWKYLWCAYSASNVLVNSAVLAVPSPTPRLWDRTPGKMRYRVATTGRWTDMTYYTRSDLQNFFDPDNANAAQPDAYTILPDNTIKLAAPTDQAYDFKGEYWRRPALLAANGDTPLIPEEHHRIIICRAAIMYGNREDAPEIISGMEAEHLVMMDKLQSDQLEDFELRRSSTDRSRQPYAPSVRGWV